MKYFVIIFTVSLLIFLTNCSTEPEEELELVIQDGYYNKISTSAEEILYSIDFDYGVIGDTCYVGGYGINWDNGSGQSVHWYIMQKLEPGRIYSISDTFKWSKDISRDPLVSMQGHLEVLTEADARLKVEYRLKNK